MFYSAYLVFPLQIIISAILLSLYHSVITDTTFSKTLTLYANKSQDTLSKVQIKLSDHVRESFFFTAFFGIVPFFVTRLLFIFFLFSLFFRYSSRTRRANNMRHPTYDQ